MPVLAALDLPKWVYLVAAWPLGLYGIWFLSNVLRKRSDEKSVERSHGWPETQALVVSSEIVWGHVEIDYKYWVSGEGREGRHKFSLPPTTAGGNVTTAARLFKNASKQHIAEYPVGAKVVVRYNPAKSEESVLYGKGEVVQPSDNPAIV
jgi:hypothetical protein